VPDAIIQEFVQADEYTVDLFADFSARVISAVPRERTYTFGGESFVSRTCQNPTLIQESIRLATKLKLIGHNTIQCFYQNGMVKFIEVNPRFGGAASPGFSAGAFTPVFLLKLLNGETVEPRIGKFKADHIMLRYTEDLFLDASALTNKKSM
jgi:carbamoyl-phosphate synthase large subunit